CGLHRIAAHLFPRSAEDTVEIVVEDEYVAGDVIFPAARSRDLQGVRELLLAELQTLVLNREVALALLQLADDTVEHAQRERPQHKIERRAPGEADERDDADGIERFAEALKNLDMAAPGAGHQDVRAGAEDRPG